jgi:hypothetical protein
VPTRVGRASGIARVSRRVHGVDVARTLSAYLRIKPPWGSVGEPLGEVLGE